MKKLILLFFVSVLAVCSVAAKGVVVLNDKDAPSLVGTSSKVYQEAQRPYIIDFSATWCMPCRHFAPVYESVAKEYDGKVDFYSVDVDKCPKLSRQFVVRVVPTLFIANPKTNKSKIITGALDRESLVAEIVEILK